MDCIIPNEIVIIMYKSWNKMYASFNRYSTKCKVFILANGSDSIQKCRQLLRFSVAVNRYGHFKWPVNPLYSDFPYILIQEVWG